MTKRNKKIILGIITLIFFFAGLFFLHQASLEVSADLKCNQHSDCIDDDLTTKDRCLNSFCSHQETRMENLIFLGFGGEFYKDLGEEKINSLADSPFDSFATKMVGAYDNPEVSSEGYSNVIKLINSQSDKTKKEFWPWLFFNSFVECNEDRKWAYREWCSEIKGMDLWDEQGALSEFYDLLEVSLKTARQTGAGGIIIDPEPYSTTGLYNTTALARRMEMEGETDKIKKRLEEIGSEMADRIDKEYPDSVILFLFTDPNNYKKSYMWLRSTNIIAKGMLERAKEENYSFKVVDGGETNISYLHQSFEDLENRLKKQEEELMPFIEEYPHFLLGGTKGLYLKADELMKDKSWDNWYQENGTQIETIEDHVPLLELLFKTREYVWLYGSARSHDNDDKIFNEWDREVAEPFDRVISQALCGNGVCETNRAESEGSCSQDCLASQGGGVDLAQSDKDSFQTEKDFQSVEEITINQLLATGFSTNFLIAVILLLSSGILTVYLFRI